MFHLKKLFTLLFATLVLALPGLLQAAQKKPNIVYIMVDDMGYGDPGCYNPKSKIPTPHIDSLAKCRNALHRRSFAWGFVSSFKVRVANRSTSVSHRCFAMAEATCDPGGTDDDRFVVAVERLPDSDGRQVASWLSGKRLRQTSPRRPGRSRLRFVLSASAPRPIFRPIFTFGAIEPSHHQPTTSRRTTAKAGRPSRVPSGGRAALRRACS